MSISVLLCPSYPSANLLHPFKLSKFDLNSRNSERNPKKVPGHKCFRLDKVLGELVLKPQNVMFSETACQSPLLFLLWKSLTEFGTPH